MLYTYRIVIILRNKVYNAFQGENDFNNTILTRDLNNEEYRGKKKEKRRNYYLLVNDVYFVVFSHKKID